MFNIITPTYNRKHLISRVYHSLEQQTCQDFKWIIVDDGSTDGTADLINQWQKTSKFEIEYYFLDINKGKANAVNYALKKCHEKYTIIADSDDTFHQNTLEELLKIWHSIEDKEKNNICAIWSLVIDEKNNIKGDKFPKDRWQVGFEERVLKRKQQLHGDKWHCWLTEILVTYPLYTDKFSHIGESHTWNRINKTYDFLCINSTFLKAYVTQNSLITSKKPRKVKARGAYYSSYYALKEVPAIELVQYNYYKLLAFEYIKSKFYYSDNKFKLSRCKLYVSWVIFITEFPIRMLKKIM